MTVPSASFPASQPSDALPGVREDQERIDRAWLRIGAGLVIAAQAMVFTLAINVEEIEGAGVRWTLHGLLFASALGALGFLGQDLLREAWRALRRRRVTIDLLFLVTLLGALAGSVLNSVRGTGSVYYEVVAILIVVHTTGRMLGARSRVAALGAVAKARADFAFCRRWVDGVEQRVPVTALQPGEVVRIAPGEAIPVDGVIVAGQSFVQETALTGEWRPVPRSVGENVLAGAYALDGDLRVRADGGPRQLDRVLAAVEEARLAPSEVQNQADRLTAWFLPVVMAVAVGTALFWWGRGPWEEALFNSMAVLLVACPCAMGLATPVAVWGALARLSRWGIIARTGDFVVGISRVDTVLLDKTGTLSTDQLVVREWRWAEAWSGQAAAVQEAVASLERGLAHPIARALAPGETAPSVVEGRRVVPGLGVLGHWQGRTLAVGEAGLGVGAPVTGNAGAKGVQVFIDGHWAATVILVEQWRPGLEEARDELAALGVAVEVISGDPEAARTLGPDWQVKAGVSAEDKLARVHALQRLGRRVLVVGDGVNDAAALSQANVAISVQGGTELAQASAAAVFSGQDLRFLPRAVSLGRATVRGIRRNLIFSFGYNVAGMAFAAGGKLHPVAAALLMVGSSAIVAVQALGSSRLTRADERLMP